MYEYSNSIFYRGYHDKYDLLKSAYYSSQYVQKKNPGIIPDSALEAFAGGAFLKGLDPILIIHDQPPLGRYLISLSILLFDNAEAIPAFLLIASVVGIFLLARIVLGNLFLALIPLGVFINEPLFINKFNHFPLLEPIQLPFIIFALYFFIKGIREKSYEKWFVLTSIMIGFVISTRFFILGLVLLFSMFIFLILKRRIDRRLIIFIASLPISLIILILSYTKTIQSGYSIIQIFGIQKYIFLYHESQFTLPFSVWDLLLFNKWHTWWGIRAISSDPQWLITWPVATVLTSVFLILGLFKKIIFSETEKVLLLWIIMYMLLLSVGDTSTRYFLPLIPILYILVTAFIIKIIKFIY